jgi:hypothetical protein
MTAKLLLTAAAVPALLVAQHQYRDRDWRQHQEETIQKSFPAATGSGPQKLLVDNVSGYIHVTGYAGGEIQVKVQKRIGADSGEALEAAKREVKLDMSQQGNLVRLYVDGPFRSGNGVNYRGDDYYGYRVAFDYDIQVPTTTEVILKTVNDGDIVLKGTTGDYDIHGLNGGIEMDAVGGSGTVRTLNGPVKVSFSRNPARTSEFHTLNGKLEVYFQPGLNADVNFHTLNGGIYTDFEVASRPAQVAAGDSGTGRWVYRSDRRRMSGRVGSGGPELTFDTLNGEILLHSKAL